MTDARTDAAAARSEALHLSKASGLCGAPSESAHASPVPHRKSPGTAQHAESLTRRGSEPTFERLIALVRLLARQAAAEALRREDSEPEAAPPKATREVDAGDVAAAAASAGGHR